MDIFHKVVTFPNISYKSRTYGPDKSVTPLYAIRKANRLAQKHSFTVKRVFNNFSKEASARIYFVAYLIYSFVYVTNCVDFLHF
jgi:hypothetical protein